MAKSTGIDTPRIIRHDFKYTLLRLTTRYWKSTFTTCIIEMLSRKGERRMKPGKRDIPVKVKISGVQLDELKKHTWKMSEAFGLDAKIESYRGVRPISFYSWDFDCILDVLDMALDDEKEYPDKEGEDYLELQELHRHLQKAYKETFG
jgi:hypothetical protein